MEAYIKAVDHYAKNRVDAEFTNKGPDHAAIVASRIFEYAEKSVKIFTGEFKSTVADNPKYIQALKRFVNSNKPLYVVLEKEPLDENISNALKFVIESSKDPTLNVHYKIATNDFFENVRNSFKSHNLYHFMLGDDRTYRIEIEPNDFKAICNFNDEKIARRLSHTFDSFFF